MNTKFSFEVNMKDAAATFRSEIIASGGWDKDDPLLEVGRIEAILIEEINIMMDGLAADLVTQAHFYKSFPDTHAFLHRRLEKHLMDAAGQR